MVEIFLALGHKFVYNVDVVLRVEHADEWVNLLRVKILQLLYLLLDCLHLVLVDFQRLQHHSIIGPRLFTRVFRLFIAAVNLAEIAFKEARMTIEDQLADCIFLLEGCQRFDCRKITRGVALRRSSTFVKVLLSLTVFLV